jgi:hypothetical protein
MWFPIIATIVFVSLSIPAAGDKIRPLPYGFGNNQYYQVIFDGEGEAAVSAKIDLYNHGPGEINQLTMEIPGENTNLIWAIQEVEEEKKDLNGRFYFQKKYYPVEKKADFLSNSVKYTLGLPVPVKSQQKASLILYYKSGNYAEKKLGEYDFRFETIKQPADLNQVRVAIVLPPELVLKGGKGKVNYKGISLPMAMAEKAEETFNQDWERFSRQLAYAPGYVKQAYGLDPWESLTVEGTYGPSWLWLYRWPLLGMLALSSGIFLICLKGIRKAIRESRKTRTKSGPLRPGCQKLPDHWSKGIIISFISSLVALGVFVLGISIINNLPRFLSYPAREAIILLLGFFLVLLLMGFLFGVPIFASLRKDDWKIGLIVFGMSLFFMTTEGMLLLFFTKLI